jgi:hypothetical protein
VERQVFGRPRDCCWSVLRCRASKLPFVGGLNSKAAIRAPLAPNWLPFLPLASIPYDPCQPALVRRPRNLQTTEDQLFIRSLLTRS